MIITTGKGMSEPNEPEWKTFGILGLIFLFNTIFFKISVAGPWDSKSFTLGIIGLTGISFIYISWYRFTFRSNGLIPWMDRWKNPLESSKKVLIYGFLIILLSWLIGNFTNQLPDPSGLILALIGALMILNSTYVLLSIGPLNDN